MFIKELVEKREDGNLYVDARKLHKWLGLKKKFTDWLNGMIKRCNLCYEEDYFTEEIVSSIEGTNLKQKRNEFFIKINSCKKLIFNNKDTEKIEMFYNYIAELTGENFAIVRLKRKEYEFQEMLEGILTQLGVLVEKQVSVINNKYRIDFVIAGSIAIEYDEKETHKYAKEKDKIRMEEINEYIKILCFDDFELDWIRVKEGEELAGIASIINKLTELEILSNGSAEIQSTFEENLYSTYNQNNIETRRKIDKYIKNKFNK